MPDTDVPLCVDLDGTLILSDLTVESILALVRRNPLYLLLLPVWLLRGKAYFKRRIAERVALDVARLPYDARLLAWLREESAGRERILGTASDQRYADAVAAHLGCFETVVGSDGVHQRGGRGKAEWLLAHCGERGFDYAGNAPVDLAVWRHARRAIVANAPPSLVRRAAGVAELGRVFPPRGGAARAWLRALRPHQWFKNVLLLVPLVAAHRVFDPQALAQAFIAFAAFCLCASAAYLLNDLLDLDADRRHPRKCRRPLAAGTLSLRAGLLTVPVLAAAGLALGACLPGRFLALLLLYLAGTLAYSFVLKRIVLLDVVALAGLYVIRVLAGAVAIAVPASFWLLAFTLFLFFSLALLKRHVELRQLAGAGGESTAGRGYATEDLPLVRSLGTTSGYLAVLVLALYIDSPASVALYTHPMLLWTLVPVLLYWVSRTWLLAGRGAVHDDPVAFALTDRVSLAVVAVFALVLWRAV